MDFKYSENSKQLINLRIISQFTVDGMKVNNEFLNISEILKIFGKLFQILKFHAWEPSFEEKVLEIRQQELKLIRKNSYLSAWVNFIWLCAPFFVAMASFTAYVLSPSSNGVLTPTIAFVSLSLFNILRTPMQLLPTLVTFLVQVHLGTCIYFNYLENYLI